MPVPLIDAAGGIITTVVFDFDGVIADTERLHLGAFQDVFAERGWALGEAEYFERYLGYDDRGLVVAYAEDQNLRLQPADVQALMTAKAVAFSRHLSSADVLFPGAKAAIQRLAERFTLGIASGALHGEIAAILDVAGLAHLFPVIVAADDVSETKPSPEPYLRAAGQLGVSPAVCVAIEDSLPGLQAAVAAGMRTIAVTTTSAALQLRIADRVVSGLGDVSPELVAELGPLRTL